MARLTPRLLIGLLILGLLATAYLFGRKYVADHPQDVPWTELRLTDPIGRFTLRKIAALTTDRPACLALLSEAGSEGAPMPPRMISSDCGYEDGIALRPRRGGIRWAPSTVVTSCPVAAALLVWERQVLQPAAERRLGQRVRVAHHSGSFSCRRLYGRSDGPFSEHATADAFDISGFTLADGTRLTVLADWPRNDARSAFLREIRDGACRLFPTTLSPDYNAAHADHLHLDMAERGRSGFGICR